MDTYLWNPRKNALLQRERGVSFEQVVIHIEQGDLLAIYEHPNQERYQGQKIMVVRIQDYAYLVPFVESNEGLFLKTIIPSRKATRDLIGETEQ